MSTFDTYDDAAATVVDADTEMVVGARMTHLNGAEVDPPVEVYTVVSREATDEQLNDLMFQIRNGRPKSDYERWIEELSKGEPL